jgi:hypothetical protein
MVYPVLVNNLVCGEIPALIDNINCKLTELAYALYNNTIYVMNKKGDNANILRLLNYREILTIKYCDPTYLEKFTIPMIASKVKLLTVGCKCRCVYDKDNMRREPEFE